MDNVPACDEGLALLKVFADAHPGAYHLAAQRGFMDPTHPMFAQLFMWKAYAQHVSTCPKCNEV